MVPYLFVLFFFLILIWIFFLSTFAASLSQLGKPLAASKRSFYFLLHRFLFRRKSFETFVFAAHLTSILGLVAFVSLAVYMLSHTLLTPLQITISALLLLFVLLLSGQLLPHLLARKSPEKGARFTAFISSFFLTLTLIINAPLLKLKELFLKEEKLEPMAEMRERITEILEAAEIKGRLNASDEKLLESVLKYKDKIVREVMIPRVDLFCLSAPTTLRSAAQLLAKEGYSRIPVYRGTIDNIMGLLMYKDVLEIYMDCEMEKKPWSVLDTPIETIAKNVFYTPETNKVSHLLQELRAKQTHMAIVVDEYGGTAGVVTIEDILEEIVGDIADEYDVSEELLYASQPGGGSWIVDARMNIRDAEDTFDITIPQEGDYDTIGGYLFHKLGTIPEQGLILEHDDFNLEVLSASERSVDSVRITPKRTS